ncbi:hypothetical protein MBANPS3_003297 [Mucor bainieri]
MFDASKLKEESREIYETGVKDIFERFCKLESDLRDHDEIFATEDLAALVVQQLPTSAPLHFANKFKMLSKKRGLSFFNAFQRLYAEKKIEAKTVNGTVLSVSKHYQSLKEEDKEEIIRDNNLDDSLGSTPDDLTYDHHLIQAIRECMNCLWIEHKMMCVFSYACSKCKLIDIATDFLARKINILNHEQIIVTLDARLFSYGLQIVTGLNKPVDVPRRREAKPRQKSNKYQDEKVVLRSEVNKLVREKPGKNGLKSANGLCANIIFNHAVSTLVANNAVSLNGVSKVVPNMPWNRWYLQKTLNGVEHDNVYFGDMKYSAGTMIKNAALELHSKFVKSKDALSPSERKVMSNGLSSILDLVDISPLGQKSLFKANDWNSIVQYFREKLHIEGYVLDEKIKDNFVVISHAVKKSRSFAVGIEYLFKAYPRYMKSRLFNELRMIEHTLEIMETKDHMLAKSSPKSVTESDYLSLIWSRYLDLLFPKESHIRVKKYVPFLFLWCIFVNSQTCLRGESTSDSSTINKKEMYTGKDNIIAFKIDIRFVVDHNGTEIDVASGEVAKHDGNKKVIDDEGKLCREGKDIVDNLLNMVSFQKSNSCVGWTIQIAGSSCLIASVHLAENGLYVNMPRGHCQLPPTIDDLDDFANSVLPVLLLFRSGVTSVASMLLEELKAKPHNVGKALGHIPQKSQVNYKAYYQRDTWYTPPGKSRSKPPCNLFGFAPPPNILQELLKLSYEKPSNLEDHDSDPEDGNGNYDEYGFKQVPNGFYNKTTNKIWDYHPHH